MSNNNNNNEEEATTSNINEKLVRPSIMIKMIRHAESQNNQVYRDARYIYRGGTPEFDEAGWISYVNEHRNADPCLSDIGYKQSYELANKYLVNYLQEHAQEPIRIITSPMKRTLETIRPTIQKLNNNQNVHVTVHGFYFESEGCHTNDIPQDGMTPEQAKDVLLLQNYNTKNNDDNNDNNNNINNILIDHVGFPYPDRGWWCNGTGPETREESEQRAAKFYLWLCEHLDEQLKHCKYDAGTSHHGYHKRHIELLIGHGDFMSLILKRIVAGYGHSVENIGVPHRSAFVHWNTGITELEYFGNGRFLLMSHNNTPHLLQQPELLSGGTLKDGWSYLMPNDHILLNAEVSIAFNDEELDDHIIEQCHALKALYLKSSTDINNIQKQQKENSNNNSNDDSLLIEKEFETEIDKKEHVKHFIVKRGLQVVGVATYSEQTGKLYDVAVRPSAGKDGTELLFNAVKEHAIKKLGRSGSLVVFPRCPNSKSLFESVGFVEVDNNDDDDNNNNNSQHTMELKH